MSEPKRLHPITSVINFLKSLKEFIVPFIFIFLFGGKGPGFDFWQSIIAAAFVLLSLIGGILSWLRFTYRVEEGELRIESGLFVRKKRYIPFERIQSLDFSEGILQRPFGLVKVKVETAGSSGLNNAEAVLTAIKKQDAIAIQEILTSVKRGQTDPYNEVEESEETLYTMQPSQLLLLASTSGGAGVVLSASLAFILQFDELIPYERVFKELQGFISTGIVFVSIILFVLFLIAWIIAVVGTMIKYAGFTVKKVEEDLVISRGLLEKRQLTIPLKRIQGILISENIVRQPLGYCSVYLETAGGSLEKDSSRTLLLPLIKKKEIAALLSPFLHDYCFTPKMVPAPKRALKRYMVRGMLLPLIIVAAALIFFRPWGYLSLLLLPFAAFWSYLKYKDAGWNLHQQQLTLTYRGIVKNTFFMRKNKIQSLTLTSSLFQEKQSLGSLQATVDSGVGLSGGEVVDIEEQDGLAIYNWYRYQ
ncbi:PH domain-containing protein [Niallia endozanthoxylica]|uniref:PH domain-containing protein n=1 Tax=Niallia endozanthoxylica TaxID=2036016 RepID=A0A5J5H9W9_9BACI|nr:PH domain-containing protein [Niallia endozanthoxylica]KAA9017097.1 PH domain-containing protein [Niallia endozanthoxylica]